MANSINLGRFNRYLEKFFNIKGSPTVFDVNPQLALELALDKGVDVRGIEGWNRYVFATNQAAVAAQFAAFRLRNPVGSNVIGVLERVTVYASAQDTANLSHGFNTTTDLATVSSGVGGIDPRGPQNSTLIASRTTLASTTDLGTGSQNGIWNGANVPFEYIQNPNQEMPILPGVAFQICAQVANIAYVVTWMWRERALEQSELT